MQQKRRPTEAEIHELAQRLLHSGFDKLTRGEQRVLLRIAERTYISRDSHRDYEAGATFGERIADRVAFFGGSWTFILVFVTFLIAWAVLNSVFLASTRWELDPYPYIFLNLMLSMLAALQAPVIMMSQNRQAAKDRAAAAHDYEVNLKAELEIMGLHEKLDEMRSRQIAELLKRQSEQLGLLTQLIGGSGGVAPRANS